jgi:2-dehydro-3-deoxygalactonokinase
VKEGLDSKSFAEGFFAGTKENLLNGLFSIRVRQLLHNADPVSSYQYLSGMLIGAELKDLKDTKSTIILVSGGTLKNVYLQALELLDLKGPVNVRDADEMFVRGQCLIWRLTADACLPAGRVGG